LRGRHPDLAIDLLAEEEAYDQSVHYDVLLRRAGEGRFAQLRSGAGYPLAPARVHRWTETELVRRQRHGPHG